MYNLDYICRAINKSDLKNEEIAEKVGVSRATIFNYKAGRQDIPSTVMYKLIKLLDLDANIIFKC